MNSISFRLLRVPNNIQKNVEYSQSMLKSEKIDSENKPDNITNEHIDIDYKPGNITNEHMDIDYILNNLNNINKKIDFNC